MKKRLKTVLKITATIMIICCIAFILIYLKTTIPSDRELWRIEDNNLSDPIIVNDLLLFKGDKGDFPNSWCEYIYAVDKNTGKPLWSSENYATAQYCNHSVGPVYTAIILLSKGQNVIYVSSSYWSTDDEKEYVLYALSGSSGEVLWKVDDYAGYPYSLDSLLGYTGTDTNYIYVAGKEGSFSAIDRSTGKPVWKQQVPNVDFSEDILIEYNDQVVYYYYSGNNTLTAFNASNGSQIWSVSESHYARDMMFSDNTIYLITSSSHSSTSFITALDVKTGNQIWELAFESISSSEIIGGEIYIWAGYGYTKSDLVVVNKGTGELVWKFNGDYSHDDIRYIIEDGVVYIGTKDGFLFALDSKTGKRIWQTKSPGLPYYFYMEKNTLVIVYEEKYVVAFDMKSGKQKWFLDIATASEYYGEFMIAGDGVVYVSSIINRKIYAIDIDTGKELWSWDLNYPTDRVYYLKALDNDVLYVDQYGRLHGKGWFFAMKTKP